MFERFTDRARRVIVLAQEEARALQHNYIGTEHLLLGLIREGEGVAAKALEAKGVTLEDTRKQVEEMIGKGNAAPNGHIPFTPHAKQVLELSLREALQLGHSYIGTEHILLGLIREGEGVGTQVLIKMDVDLGELRSTTIDMIRGNAGGTDDKGDLANAGGVQDKHAQSGSAILDQFGRNLTAEAAEGKLDPVIGRSTEIERVMVVLSRRTKNNPVLIGEPGVGKTAVVEGLAQKIVAGDVPETLRGKQVYSLDLGSMVAGSRYRGDFEERLKKVLKEIKTRGDIVLFIDEIHTIVGAGSADGADAWRHRALHRRDPHHRRRGLRGRRTGRVRYAQADARAWRAADNRRHDDRRIPQIHRKGCGAGTPFPADPGRGAVDRGDDRDPQGTTRPL